MTFFFRIHLYTQLLEERTNICIIRLLTVVLVTTDRRETFFFYCVYTIDHKHEENFISFYRMSSRLK